MISFFVVAIIDRNTRNYLEFDIILKTSRTIVVNIAVCMHMYVTLINYKCCSYIPIFIYI